MLLQYNDNYGHNISFILTSAFQSHRRLDDNAMDAAPPGTPPAASPVGSGAEAVQRLRDLNPDVAAASASRRRLAFLVAGKRRGGIRGGTVLMTTI